jgi:hypothetical protein
MLEIEYEFREKDLMHYNALQMKNNEAFNKNVQKNRLIYPGVMFLIALYFWAYEGQVDTALYVLGITLLWAIVVPIALKWEYQQRIMATYTNDEKKNMYGKYRLVIEPSDLYEKSPTGKHRMPWSELLRVDYSQKYVYIVIDIDVALVIPRETVSSGDLVVFTEQAGKMIDRFS